MPCSHSDENENKKPKDGPSLFFKNRGEQASVVSENTYAGENVDCHTSTSQLTIMPVTN
jgi:hypothetical protein